MSIDDTEYYRQRAIAELALALASERQDVAAIHEELARQYQALAGQKSLRPTLRIVTPSRKTA
ncbi:MAG: hypothetical protein ABIS38_10125 [Sphingomicrobium sp.]